MISRPDRTAHAWILTLLLALGFVIGTGLARAQRVRFVTSTALEPQRLDDTTPSGRAAGTRVLILPVRSPESAHWIIQTQQMLAQHEWRVRHIDYENAPHGRTVSTGSPYRWWLGIVATGAHVLTGNPLALCMDEAALWADPVLHGLLILGTTLFVLRHFGSFAASLLPIGLATVFPLSAAFLPGAPDDQVLSIAASLWSVLPLLAGIQACGTADPKSSAADVSRASRRGRACFIGAGISGGLGLWFGVASAAPILAGIVAGACLAAWLARRTTHATEREPWAISRAPWWAWSIAGAATSLAAFLLEYAPAHLATWQMRVNHPLYAVAWLGAGAVITAATPWLERAGRTEPRRIAAGACGVLMLAAVPVAMSLRDDPGFLARDVASYGLTRFSSDGVAGSVFALVGREGLTRHLVAAMLPLAPAAAGVWLLRRRGMVESVRATVATALGPVAILLVAACWRLGAWAVLDAALVALFVVTTAGLARVTPAPGARGIWIGLAALVFGLGATQVLRPLTGGAKRAVDESEFAGLVHRDLAHWLAKRTQGAEPVVLAPPDEALALAYYGGLRGLGTLNWENGDGIRAATRVLRSTSPEEGEALFSGRGITHVILPSWDRYFEQFAGGGSGGATGSFLDALRQLSLPAWMRPIPYQMPKDAQSVGRSVIVLEVVEEQSEALELGRLAEYFVEMGQMDLAAAVGQSLRRFPADLGAWVARVQVEMAVGNQPAKAASLPNVISMVESGGDRTLAWDRRVALAIVLARGQRMDLAREQVRRCLGTINEEHLRALTSGPLYRLLYLARTFEQTIADERLRALALDLLPAEARARLAGPTPATR